MIENMIEGSLQKIGFQSKEAKIITALSSDPPHGAFPSNIAKKTGLNRYTTYDVLERLYHEGVLLKLNRNGRLWYQLGSPNSILDWLDRKQKKVKQQISLAESLVIPELAKLHKQTPNEPSIRILEGRQGIFTIAQEVLKQEHSEVFYLSSVRTITRSFRPNVLKRHMKQKKERNILSKLIFPLQEKAEVQTYITQYYVNTGNTTFECRLFDFKTISNELMIYSNQVAIINIDSSHPFVVHVHSKEVFESYRELFQGIWRKSRLLKLS